MAEQQVSVVIVGGGFGGRYAAERLARRAPKGTRITLIDRNDYMLYTPMLTEVAGRSVQAENIKAPVSDLPAVVRFVQGEVSAADLTTRRITLADGQTFDADQLVFALGSTTNFRDIEGAREHSLTMKTLEDAERAQAQAQRNVELAAASRDLKTRMRLLTFVVAGGGYTGVETVAALNDLVRDTARRCGVGQDELRVVLIEPTNRLMEEMPESLASYSKRRLERDRVEVLLGSAVGRVEPGSLTLKNDQIVPYGLLVWDTGITPNSLVGSLGCRLGKKGGIVVDSTFKVPNMPGVWALGDCAEIPKPDGSGKFFEPTAQNATREGALLADNILATLRHRPVRPFTYKQIGELAVISRRRGVAFVMKVKVNGMLGWLMWRGIYVAKMPGWRKRFGILADWLRLAIDRFRVPAASGILPAAT